MKHSLLSLQATAYQAKQPMPAMWHDCGSYVDFSSSKNTIRTERNEIKTRVREGVNA